MSKGEIVDHLGEGLYRVKLLYAVERILAEKEKLTSRRLEIDTTLPGLQLIEMDARSAVNSKARDIDLLLPAYQANPEEFTDQIKDLQVALIRLKLSLAKASFDVGSLRTERIGIIKRVNQINRIPAEKVVEAWCADYTESLSGEIGVIDVNDEGGKSVLVYPGYDSADFVPLRDGQLFARGAQSAGQVFLNAALLPGVQKWNPKYRLAIITRINADLCDITMDDAESSAQRLNINEVAAYTDVPIQYMDCNASAFEEGDRVVVRFFESGPQVIGFESFPRPCEESGFAFVPSLWSGSDARITWGEPFLDSDEEEINPPLGTPGGASPAWSASPQPSSDGYKVAQGKPDNIGNRNWVGLSPARDILSWDGAPSRVYDKLIAAQNTKYPAWQGSWTGGSRVYHKFRVLVDLAQESVSSFTLVCGAAALVGTSGPEKLLVVCSDQYSKGQSFKLYSWPISSKYQKTGPATLLFSTTAADDSCAVTDWYFNASGSKAVCTLRNQPADFSGIEAYSRVDKGFLDASFGFSFSTIWDRYASEPISGVRTDIRYYSRSLESTDSGCGDNKIGVSTERKRTFSTVNSAGNILFPLYVEFIDDREVTVFYKEPARVSGNTYNAEGKRITKEYPHPCAGTGDWPDTVRWPSITEDSVKSGNFLTAQGSGEIITSEGSVLAREKFTVRDERQINYTRSDESVSISADCGSFYISDLSYSFSYSDSTLTGGIGLGGGILAIDARNGFCVLSERYYQSSESGALSGIAASDDAEDLGYESFLRVTMENSASNEKEYLSVYLGGVEIESILVDEIIYDGVPSRTFRSTDYWVVFPFTLPLSDCDDSATQNDSFTYSDYTSAAPAIDRLSRLLDGGSGTIKNKSALSVIYLRSPFAEPFFVQYIEGVTDTSDYLFQRSGDYVMNRLTVY